MGNDKEFGTWLLGFSNTGAVVNYYAVSGQIHPKNDAVLFSPVWLYIKMNACEKMTIRPQPTYER